MHLSHIFIKVTRYLAGVFVKNENPTHVFSCKFYKNFENTFFIEHFLAAASTVITWNTTFLSFLYFLLTLAMLINWS